MLYRFKSKAGADVVMLEPVGKRLLEVLGKDPQGPGILLPADMPQAVLLIKAAVAQDEARRTSQATGHTDWESGRGEDDSGAEASSKPDPVSFRMRVAPFLELLGHSLREQTEVVWGV